MQRDHTQTGIMCLLSFASDPVWILDVLYRRFMSLRGHSKASGQISGTPPIAVTCQGIECGQACKLAYIPRLHS